jgi:hypothetical protein
MMIVEEEGWKMITGVGEKRRQQTERIGAGDSSIGRLCHCYVNVGVEMCLSASGAGSCCFRCASMMR